MIITKLRTKGLRLRFTASLTVVTSQTKQLQLGLFFSLNKLFLTIFMKNIKLTNGICLCFIYSSVGLRIQSSPRTATIHKWWSIALRRTVNSKVFPVHVCQRSHQTKSNEFGARPISSASIHTQRIWLHETIAIIRPIFRFQVLIMIWALLNHTMKDGPRVHRFGYT